MSCLTFLAFLAAPLLAGSGAAHADIAVGAGLATAESIIAKWPARPRMGAAVMMAKYGAPQEVSSEKLVWHDKAPFKRIMVTRQEFPHDFPLPHMDFIEHTITYNVPQDKVGDLIAFDASSTINRTAGELSARCDLEGHNVLTLNLDHDIVTGKKSVEQARRAFGEIVVADVKGEHPPYVESLQFQPAADRAACFADEPVIPGAPRRPGKADGKPDGLVQAASVETGSLSDAEILASLIAVDMNEVLAAAAAGTEKASPQVLEYAKMLHKAHGENLVATMKLGQTIGVTPINTPEVDKLYVNGAGELAKLVPLDGEAFGAAYLAAMVKCHTEALAMIDGRFLAAADDGALKKHLTDTRAHIAHHLEKAKELQKSATAQ